MFELVGYATHIPYRGYTQPIVWFVDNDMTNLLKWVEGAENAILQDWVEDYIKRKSCPIGKKIVSLNHQRKELKKMVR